MIKVLNLINKLMKDKDKFDIFSINEKSSEEKIKFYNWFSLIKEEGFEKIFNEIYSNIGNIFNEDISLTIYDIDLNLNEEDIKTLYSFFVIKGIQKTYNLVSYKTIHYQNSYTVLNNISKYYLNFCIFYLKKEVDSIEIKKKFFKLISILVDLGIINEKKITLKKNTQIFWSFDIKSIQISIENQIKFSTNKWNINKINDNYYLTNIFFQDTCSVFRKNLQSKKKIIFKNEIYLKNLLKTSVEIDIESFNSIKQIIEEDLKLNISNLKEEILIEIDKHITIDLEIEEIKYNNMIEYEINFKKEISFIDSNLSNKEKFINIMKKYFENKKINIYDIINKLEKIEFKVFKELEKENIEKIIEKDNNSNLDYNLMDDKFFIKLIKKLKILKETNKIYTNNINKIEEKLKEKNEIQSKISKLMRLYNLEVINKLKLENKKIYFPFYFDFRGRFFIDSQIGTTDFKLSRYFFHYGTYTNEEISKSLKKKIDISKYKDKINEIINLFKIDKKYEIIIFWIMISLGKEFIEKNKSYITTEEILTKSIEIIKNYNPIKIEDKIIKLHYIRLIESLKKEIILKRLIHKDATASFIQNSIRVFGAKDKNSLKLSNMSDCSGWYDPYMLALEKWKESLIIKEKHILISKDDKIHRVSVDYLKYFTRKTSKYPLMTGPYAAKYLTVKDYFLESVEEEFDIEIKEDNNLSILFKNFNDFIEKSFWTDYYLSQSPKILISYVDKLLENESSIIIESHDIKTDLIYYKFKNKTWDLIIEIPISNKKIRKTKVIKIIDMDNVDIRKLKDSIRANCVHFVEALLVRDINKKFNKPLLSIHDCFLVDLLNVTKFIEIANKEIHKPVLDFIEKEKAYKVESYSWFIFI